MALSREFSNKNTRFGPPPSSQTNVVPEAPPAVRQLARNLSFETDNPQIRIAFRDRVLYAHDFVHGTHTGISAQTSFDAGQVIDGTNPSTPKHVSPQDPDLRILKDRVYEWKKMWTPIEVLRTGGIRTMTDLLNDETSHGAVLNPAVPG